MDAPDLMVIEPFGRIPRWAVDRPRGSYLGFFVNGFGERWIFVAAEGLVRVAGETFGWEEHRRRPTAEDLDRFEAYDEFLWPEALPLNADERLWLASCLASAAPGLRSVLEVPVHAK